MQVKNRHIKKKTKNSNSRILREGNPWQSTSYGSALPLQGAQVQSLVGELKSHMPQSAPPKKKKKKKEKKP